MASFTWTLVSSGAVLAVEETLAEALATSGAEAGKNLKLDADGDLDFTGGRLQMVRGGDAIAQSLQCRLRAVAGEWFRDLTLGLPMLTDIIGKNPNLVAVRSLIRTCILDTPGVLSISSLLLALSSERVLTVTFTCTTDFGELAAVADLEATA